MCIACELILNHKYTIQTATPQFDLPIPNRKTRVSTNIHEEKKRLEVKGSERLEADPSCRKLEESESLRRQRVSQLVIGKIKLVAACL